jgi:hypothetical protein
MTQEQPQSPVINTSSEKLDYCGGNDMPLSAQVYTDSVSQGVPKAADRY